MFIPWWAITVIGILVAGWLGEYEFYNHQLKEKVSELEEKISKLEEKIEKYESPEAADIC